MPRVQQLAECGLPMRKHMAEDILPAASRSGHMEFFVEYAMRMLEKYPGDTPRARVFAHALQVCASSDEEWKSWHVVIHRALSPEKYKEVAEVLEWAPV